MEIKHRKSVSESLNKYCHLSKDYDIMEITEWTNGEGFDLYISSGPCDEYMSLTFGEFDLLKKLVMKLFNDNFDDEWLKHKSLGNKENLKSYVE